MSFTPLHDGDTIGVFAPSSYVEREYIEAARTAAEDMGYRVYIHPQTYERHAQMAGTRAQKIAALHDLYADPNIKAIWAAGGGNRALGLLDGLDYDLIRTNPKPLIGFSDVTALLNGITARTAQANIHAPVFKQLHTRSDAERAQIVNVLRGAPAPMPMLGTKSIQSGNAEGVLVGGNLSLFHLLCGTDDCPDLSGAILCFEDCGDHVSRFDRMFIHMKRCGVFDAIGGLVIGTFSDLQDGPRAFGLGIEEIIGDLNIAAHKPIIMHAPFGHGDENFAFPIGGKARLDAGAITTLEIIA